MTDPQNPALQGHCLCGRITYHVPVAARIWAGLCHCDSCRRACAAPVVGWFGVTLDQWRWTAAMPKSYASSDWATRYFCPDCGTQMGYFSRKLPHEMHGLAATLDAPEDFSPTAHYFYSKRLLWLHLSDPHPRFLDGGKTLDQTAPRASIDPG